MSAPPRATISFRPAPARPWGAGRSTGRGRGREGSANGLRWIGRIDVIDQFWPAEPGLPRDIAVSIDWSETREPDRRALAAAWEQERGARVDDPSIAGVVAGLAAEAVSDELREVARRADPAEWNLPPVALLTEAGGSPRRPASGDIRLAISVLARVRGTIFLRAAEPMSITVARLAFDLWAIGRGADRERR
jgi:hypothetical protein